ncbi:helix-turn-helix domain-containing protein [Phyllobacterium leguminum]|uniref:helix-turn-helix domain-containing protein n=1 Tax=Phyllobacterium leguminum TaxID=314237 RepID=UPI000DA115D0|nr:AraC family transcriptional regulator [Phyllobacterium leguminum]
MWPPPAPQRRRRETGMSYQQWRQQWRLLKAVELLAGHRSITSIAFDLGFASDSAFIAFFKGMTGHTPRAFMGSSVR